MLIPENDNLLASALLLQGSNHLCSLNGGSAHCYLIIIGNEQYLIQLNSITLGHVQTVYIYNLTRGYLILFATGFDNSVNLYSLQKDNSTSECS